MGETVRYSSLFFSVLLYAIYSGDVTELVGYGCDYAVTNLEMINRNGKSRNLVLIW